MNGDEDDVIASCFAPLAHHAAARGLKDDAAVLVPSLGCDLIYTHDILAADVHYLHDDPPQDVAWKLVAVNLSDLAAMGARPVGLLCGLALSARENVAWLEGFAQGLDRALRHFDVPLLGGDTVTGVAGAVLGATAIGEVDHGRALGRGGAVAGDIVWVSGTIGDAGLGLEMARGLRDGDGFLLGRFRRPTPRLALGRALCGMAHAMMDISDGLLLDAMRLAKASEVALHIDLPRLPLSAAARNITHSPADLLARGAAGDDYELLFTAPPACTENILALGQETATPVTRLGEVRAGRGLHVRDAQGAHVPLDHPGWRHHFVR